VHRGRLRRGGTFMSVSVRIPTILRSYTGGAAEVTAEAGTLREVISDLDASYPGIGGRILRDGGRPGAGCQRLCRGGGEPGRVRPRHSGARRGTGVGYPGGRRRLRRLAL